ncbi:MAG TPA: (2Fe-2S)-binding protein [Thermodesulfobacteriaceae bacterium]|nr:(2Fe-2S)-binding protein [Thermodesulfobacteriaceae bacterium]
MIRLEVNGKNCRLDVPHDMPLLWVLRESLGLTGTKYGCGTGMCGSCTVIVSGEAVRSCQVSAGDVRGKVITTIEGLDINHPVKQAWISQRVPECGYCQPGQIMQAVELLTRNPHPSDRQIDEAMGGNLCRCGTYKRIRRAIMEASGNVENMP